MTTHNLVPISKQASLWSPLSFRRAMDRFFEDWFEGIELPQLLQKTNGFYAPELDVSETDKEIRVTAELPGLSEKDIKLSISQDQLSLRGDKKEEKEEKSENFYRKERHFGSFERIVQLPSEVQAKEAKATFKNGVLSVVLPKSPSAQRSAQEIPIKTA